ncbi:diacylglycerol acyltransferase [Cutaneotrichosporon oleaginosum]|uniref:Diacylglycerol O-acyltransferase n=1 Tax=Cutaneotrichosporon oleaginosum TaxID=879819 RepID=A0A0J0XU39_9TREE|nr:diacylglycerol acyltransferase [Cutaneotrichosporon oleaginosum]KLT44580.1 diacylglycerol acyltransferase [Cutaneotrichosporon oleaginosum]TXT13906.1 hypothetical protein COLE_00099 [Cutaneotrichosporon oleaginosum]
MSTPLVPVVPLSPAEDGAKSPVDHAPAPTPSPESSSPRSPLVALKHDKPLSRSSSLLELLHLKDVHIPTPPPVKFAPLVVPRHRRLQTAVVATWSVMIPICLTVFYGSLFFSKWLRPLAVIYAVWFIVVDRAWRHKGGRRKDWVRRSAFWRYFADYYPITTVKEADLPADRKYVFAYHPHGIISMGAACTFATEATGFSSLFPGVTCHLLTLDANFWIPLYRDILMGMGLASVSKRSCRSILKMGRSICIVIGGASESLYAYPGTNNLTLKKRLGFIKIAIREGANLVPVYGFGENDIYELLPNEKGTMTYKFQKWFQGTFGFTVPFFHGRGVFTYNYGLMPHRRPVTVVVGAPIPVKQIEKPTDEEVQAVHNQYIEALQALWDKHKDEYAKDRKSELKLVA